MDKATLAGEAVVHELHFAGATETAEDGQLITKTILRTGTWAFTPRANGTQRRPLKIVRDGQSDADKGVISLSELVANFEAQALPYVSVPLSDDEREHNNATRNNTGFVRKLWIEDGEDGISRLKAGIEFTEPDVREKALRGTYADVSCGIPFGVVRKSDGQQFNAVLEHVALTNKPFIDGLDPFAIAASDDQTIESVSYEEETQPGGGTATLDPPVQPERTKTLRDFALKALREQLKLGEDFEIVGIEADTVTVRNVLVDKTWTVPLLISLDGDNPVRLGEISKWEAVKSEEEQVTPPAEVTKDPAAPSAQQPPPGSLAEAHRQREARFSLDTTTGGTAMPQTGIEALDRLDLSDEAKAALQPLLKEHDDLRKRLREQDAEQKIVELSDKGLKERPGFLKLYREVYLNDDGGPAAILLSDDGAETKLTAVEILDRAVEALADDKGQVNLTGQHLVSGNDSKPPVDAGGETKSVEERAAEAREALYGKTKK